jgi:hypothetical protein
VLGSDVVVPELERLAETELEDLLGAGCERDMTRRRLLALTDDLDDFFADRGKVDVETLESLGGDTFALIEQTEENVLGTYVIVIE